MTVCTNALFGEMDPGRDIYQKAIQEQGKKRLMGFVYARLSRTRKSYVAGSARKGPAAYNRNFIPGRPVISRR